MLGLPAGSEGPVRLGAEGAEPGTAAATMARGGVWVGGRRVLPLPGGLAGGHASRTWHGWRERLAKAEEGPAGGPGTPPGRKWQLEQ